VSGRRAVPVALLFVAIVAGTSADAPQPVPPLTLGGYRVLAVDFHVHSSTWSDGAVTPWGIVLQAQRDGLDAIAFTGHNQIWDGKAARRFSAFMGGPTVIPGQEILSLGHHVIAVGTHTVIEGGHSAATLIDHVHRQGGIAIAAHPFKDMWAGFDATAMKTLDGGEICHPIVYWPEQAQHELEQFAARGRFAAIGSSDFHGIGRLGLCRTYVFARDTTAEAILDAVRARRTVIYGRGGKAYGDPALVQLAADHPHLRETATVDPPAGVVDWISRVTGVLGLFGFVLASSRPITGRSR
jgi:predicted metal-dependent phosphoesterase TrpH